jgi:hypothetical protein
MLIFTFSPLLAGRATTLIVARSTSKCELQLLCTYIVFLMSFSFPDPLPIAVPHYAYLDVVVRYIPTPPSGMIDEYTNLKIRPAIHSMSSRLWMQVRSSSYWSALTDLGLRWSRIIPCSTINHLCYFYLYLDHFYHYLSQFFPCSSFNHLCYFYLYLSRCHKHGNKRWNNCWCRWRSCVFVAGLIGAFTILRHHWHKRFISTPSAYNAP